LELPTGDSRYSSLRQINRSNVSSLKLVWSFETGESGGLETTPIVIDGMLPR
jgi:quinoprotein glucose dehydrogenase